MKGPGNVCVSQEKIERQVEEIKALHARMQQSHEGHLEETNALKYQIEQYKNAANQSPLIQRLTEENNKLKEAVKKNQSVLPCIIAFDQRCEFTCP